MPARTRRNTMRERNIRVKDLRALVTSTRARQINDKQTGGEDGPQTREPDYRTIGISRRQRIAGSSCIPTWRRDAGLHHGLRSGRGNPSGAPAHPALDAEARCLAEAL